MTTILYDGTFEGFLSAIFEIYDKKLEPEKIFSHMKYRPEMFDHAYEITTFETHSKRVWKSLCKKLSRDGQKIVYYTFLSEIEGVEILLFRFIKNVFASNSSIEQNFGDPVVLEAWQIAKKVGKEIHRVPMFVRFQKTSDDIYFASFDPAYDILHLATDHFVNRFAGQKWVIYDIKRNYGYYYDLKKLNEITFTESTVDFSTGRLKEEVMAPDELLFQKLWKIYFTEMAIKERINPKLHRQLMPKRYWKYLVEKWE
jgi:probable DNA metabolism protein